MENPASDRIPYGQTALVDLLDAFASNEPVPGGGSAVALAGALGVSLLMKVAALAKTRTGAPEETADLAEAAARLRPLRDQLLDLIDRDSDAYREIIAAFRLPKASEDERASRSEAIQTATRLATDMPLEIMRACQQALAGAVIVARNGYAAAASDAAVGIDLLGSAARGAGLSIDVNMKGVRDEDYRARISTERMQLDGDSAADAERARQALPL